MGDGENCRQEPPDPAEALANMADSRNEQAAPPPEADEKPKDATEALDELAARRAETGKEAEGLAPADDETIDMAAAAATGLSGAEAFRARRARGAKITGQQARAHAHAYRRMMIPLLLVVGVLLILIGLLDVSMLIAADEADRQTRWHALMMVVALVSFPLAAVLFFGAWWFHREVSHRR